MSSDYKDKSFLKSKGIVHSFQYAFKGIKIAATSERNMKVHLIFAFVVLFLGVALKLSSIEWVVILFAIGGVLSLELVNTAIEKVVDLETAEFHPLAQQAKDIAAGAVLIYAGISVTVGLIIFLPKIIRVLF